MDFSLLDQAASAVTSSTSSAEATTQGQDVWQLVGTIAIWVVVIAIFYFCFMRPQKKKQKQEEELRNNIEIGDDITTIGGIVGKVISVRVDDDTFVLETASDKTRMRFKKWAISSVDTPDKQPKDPKKEKAEKAEKEDKKKKSDEKTED